MSKLTTDLIRNIALIGHSGEGKTSLAEAMLFNAKSIDRLGKVDDGTSTMDFDAEEINRKISISLAAAYGFWNDFKLNILDVPGFFDFEGEMVSALTVADSAIIVTSASGTLSVGTEKALEMCVEKNVPALIYINQINKENSDYNATYDAIAAVYGSKVVPVELPIMESGKMTGWVDILKSKAYKFDSPAAEAAIPDGLASAAEDYKNRLIEIAAETDDELIEKFFEGEELSDEELTRGIHTAIMTDKLIPLMAGNATTNTGVTNLMDRICEFLPSPNQAPAPNAEDANGKEITVPCNENGSFSAQIFKAVADPFVGKLLYFKVMSGKLNSGDQVFNTVSEKPEKASSLYVLKGKKQEAADSLIAGDIGALAKLVATNIGDTLCDTNNKIKFPAIQFPEPVISLAVTSAKAGEEDKVINGLNRMLEEDSTFRLEKNVTTGDVLVSGLGEAQLDIICRRLKNKFGVEAKLSDPKIAYRETIRKVASAQGKHKKQSGGHGQYGDAHIRFEPYPDGDFVFEDEIVGGVVPKQYIPAVEKGLRECIKEGVLAGYPMVNLKAVLFFGSYHDVDSSEMAFKLAAELAYKKGCAEASPCLLEPVNKVEITVPESYMGDILGDLNKRRGRILGMEGRGKKQVINAEVPYAEMFKYATDLRSMTQGRGKFKMEFLRYDEVPANIAQKVIEEAKKQKAQ